VIASSAGVRAVAFANGQLGPETTADFVITPLVTSLPPVTDLEINQVHPLLFTGIDPGTYWVSTTAGQVLDASGNGSITQVTVGADGELRLSVINTVAQAVTLSFDALSGNRRYETIVTFVTFVAPSVRRFDFNRSATSPNADGYTGVLPRQTYSATLGYGWNVTVGSVQRSVVAASPTALFLDKHTTTSARTFLVDAAIGQAYDIRLHLGDSVARDMEVSVNGGPFVRYTTARNQYLSPVVTTTATTDRLEIAFRAVSGFWVINGLEIATAGNLPTNPLRPAVGLSSPLQSLASGANKASGVEDAIGVLNEESLSATVQAALNSWAKTGIDDTTIARMQSVVFEIIDLDSQGELGQAGNGIIRIDDDGLGLGWFIDPNPSTDDAFVSPSVHQAIAIAGQPAASHFDLLTVVMHELGHIAGYPDLVSTTTREATLMTETLPVGVRRFPVVDQDTTIFAWTGDFAGTPHALAFQLQHYRQTRDQQARDQLLLNMDDDVSGRAISQGLRSPSQHQRAMLDWPDGSFGPLTEQEEDWNQLQSTESDHAQRLRLDLVDEIFADF
jgi:hypothetical protein